LRPSLRKRGTVLGAIKAWPADGGAGTKAIATASLDGPCARCPANLHAGTKGNGLTARTKELHRSGDSDDIILFPCRGFARGRKRDGGPVFPALANPGDPNGPSEACQLMRTQAR